MADRPILFSAPMVRALLDGRKTQTRRVLKPQPDWLPEVHSTRNGNGPFFWPVGALGQQCGRPVLAKEARYAVGDRLWVRETWCEGFDYDEDDKPLNCDSGPRIFYAASECPRWYDTDADEWRDSPKWRPSIFMRRAASRLTLTVTDVRVERLQDISEEDAQAEGRAPCSRCGDCGWVNSGPDGGWQCTEHLCGAPDREWYAELWDSINGPGAWKENPWVVAVSFAVGRHNIDAPDLPEGVWDKCGKLFYTCLSCGQATELDGELEGFDPAVAYCGGSPRCIP